MADYTSSVESAILEVREAAPPDVSDHKKPFSEMGLDSLDVASILLVLEERYDIKISDADMAALTNIEACATYLEKRVG